VNATSDCESLAIHGLPPVSLNVSLERLTQIDANLHFEHSLILFLFNQHKDFIFFFSAKNTSFIGYFEVIFG